MANNDELFDGVGLAIGTQTGFGARLDAVADLTSTVSEAEGGVLGDKNSGDADSGIVIPNIEQVFREVAPVTGSFTESADAFQRAAINSLAITIALQGNGATISSTPALGECEPAAGIKALWESAGLVGADGVAPVYEFAPSAAASSYTTIKLWLADLSFVFTDCLVDNVAMAFEPGGAGLATFNIRVGSHDPTTDFADTITFPTFNYGTQKTLANPTVEGVAHTWGQVRGFNTHTTTIANSLEEFGDSNVVGTGIRQSFTRRLITVDSVMYVETADSSFEYDNLTSTTAPTADLSFQVGTVGVGDADANAVMVECNNLQAKGLKYNRIGTATVAEISGAKCTSLAASTEFLLTYN